MSNSLPPHRLELPRLLCPWNFLGKNTGVGSHSLLQGTRVEWYSTRAFRHPGSFCPASAPSLGYYPGLPCPRWPPQCPHSREQEKGRGQNGRLHSLCLLLSFFSDFKKFVMIMDSVSQTFAQDTAGIHCFSIVSGTWTGEIFFFLTSLCNLKDRRSPTRDWTQAMTVKTLNPNH